MISPATRFCIWRAVSSARRSVLPSSDGVDCLSRLPNLDSSQHSPALMQKGKTVTVSWNEWQKTMLPISTLMPRKTTGSLHKA